MLKFPLNSGLVEIHWLIALWNWVGESENENTDQMTVCLNETIFSYLKFKKCWEVVVIIWNSGVTWEDSENDIKALATAGIQVLSTKQCWDAASWFALCLGDVKKALTLGIDRLKKRIFNKKEELKLIEHGSIVLPSLFLVSQTRVGGGDVIKFIWKQLLNFTFYGVYPSDFVRETKINSRIALKFSFLK